MHKNCLKCGKEFGVGKYPGNFKRQRFCGQECGRTHNKFDYWKALEVMWSRIDRNGPGGCWLWQASTNNMGYAEMWIEDKLFAVHRYVYQLAHGTIRRDQWCLHKCDVPRCVNPAHIFLGNAKDNMRDMMAKGRGVFIGNHALTPDQVREIRRLRDSGLDNAQIGEKFGIGHITISRIYNRRSYADVE